MEEQVWHPRFVLNHREPKEVAVPDHAFLGAGVAAAAAVAGEEAEEGVVAVAGEEVVAEGVGEVVGLAAGEWVVAGVKEVEVAVGEEVAVVEDENEGQPAAGEELAEVEVLVGMKGTGVAGPGQPETDWAVAGASFAPELVSETLVEYCVHNA